MQPQWIHMKKSDQAVDTSGFEISSFVTVLLDFKKFENVLFGKLDRLRVTSSVLYNSETNYQRW